MKKIIISFLLCVVSLTASAQIKSLDLKGSLRSDLGLGAGLTFGVLEYVDFAPSFTYFFLSDGTAFSIDGDFHYNVVVNDRIELFPVLGASVYHRNYGHKADKTKFGLNAGAGIRYYLTDQVSLIGEAKYQFLFGGDGLDDPILNVGISLNL